MDGMFLHFLKLELNDLLIGAKVSKIYQPIKDEIIINFRNNKETSKLLVNVMPENPRMYVVNESEINPEKPLPFCMLLRKYLTGGLVEKIYQQGLDRIIYIAFSVFSQIGTLMTLTLVIELIGRYSNIILIDSNSKILGAAKIINNNVKNIIIGSEYIKIEQNNKINLLKRSIKIEDNELLFAKLQGLSKNTYNYLMAEKCNDVKAAYKFLYSIINENFKVKPVILLNLDNTKKDILFFDTDLCSSIKQKFNSFSELLEEFYKDKEKEDLIKQKTKTLNNLLNVLIERVKKRIIKQEEEFANCEKKEKYKLSGDLLSANIYMLKKGMHEIDVENFYSDVKEIISIKLDGQLSGAQNVQKYYKAYKKLQTAQKILEQLIKKGKQELEYLNTVSYMLTQTTEDRHLNQIKQELESQKYINPKHRKEKERKIIEPKQIKLMSGNVLLIGQNNVQNDLLTFKIARKNDLWFHVQNIPGSHVILSSDSNKFPKQRIEEAAKVAAFYSKAQNSTGVAVDYTSVKYVKKMPGAKPGMVIYTNYKTIFVKPQIVLNFMQ